jgi:hypothetical protein
MEVNYGYVYDRVSIEGGEVRLFTNNNQGQEAHSASSMPEVRPAQDDQAGQET